MLTSIASRCGLLILAGGLIGGPAARLLAQEKDPFGTTAESNDPFSEPAAAPSDQPFGGKQREAASTPCDQFKPLAVDVPQAAAAREIINRALDSSTSLDFIDAPLSDVFSFIEHEKKVQIVIDERAFDDLGSEH